MTHTPGPWFVEQPNTSTPHIWIVANNDHGGIAKIETCNHDDGLGERHTDEDHANARLIAAAPDLLEALEAAERQIVALYRAAAPFGNYGTNSDGSDANENTFADNDEAAIAARAAIAKARGETA